MLALILLIFTTQGHAPFIIFRLHNYQVLLCSIFVTHCSAIPGQAMRLVPKKFGLVEIFYDGIWWNVCADSEWDRRDALVACRQRGFPSGLPHRQPICPWNTVNCHSKFGRFKCTGTEATLEDCEFTTEDLTNTWTCHDGFAVAECLYDEPDGDWFDGFNLTDSSIFNSTAVPIVTKKKYSGTYKITGIARIFEGAGGQGSKHKIYKGCLKGTFIYSFCSIFVNQKIDEQILIFIRFKRSESLFT